MHKTILKKGLQGFMAFALALWVVVLYPLQTEVAYAATTEIEETLTDLQRQIEQSAKDFDDASAKVENLEKLIEENEQKIAELEEELPTQQTKSNDATVSLYKMHQDGYSLINLVLNAGSLDDFINSLEYIDRIHKSNLEEISRLTTMKEELETTKEGLEEARSEAISEKAKAETALKEAQEKREEVQQKALEEARAQEEAAAKAAAEAAAAEAAQQAAAQEQQEQQSSAPSNAGPPLSGTPSEIDWSTDKTAFVNEWGPRIDNYLSGSPLSGQGRTFAEAAWNYGVDPRWSPAISNTESTKGRYCFLPHNAWGWGSVSWGSWEEAIDAHVRGLARGYGYTISVASAQKYCPPNWEHWYNSTLAQMNMI